MSSPIPAPAYTNPVLNADWPDPDAVQVDGSYYLIASSFNRVPGLPILRSRNLVDWEHLGHALPELPGRHYSLPRHGSGVWAPALRHHDGKFWIFYPDPDHGIFVLTATDPAGPWTEPHLLYAGRGLIDPCPLWDDDGSAYLVHGWAKSRIGVKNRLTVHRMSPDARSLLDGGVHVIDGEDLAGYTTIEGPKFYKRDGWYWIFAPAGGVATGWQSVFRSRSPFGPYEGRRVLAPEFQSGQRTAPGGLGHHPGRRGLVPAFPGPRPVRPGGPPPADGLGPGRLAVDGRKGGRRRRRHPGPAARLPFRDRSRECRAAGQRRFQQHRTRTAMALASQCGPRLADAARRRTGAAASAGQ